MEMDGGSVKGCKFCIVTRNEKICHPEIGTLNDLVIVQQALYSFATAPVKSIGPILQISFNG